MKKISVFRTIIKREYRRFKNHPISAGDTVFVDFDCGHSWRFKGSKEPKTNRAKCIFCSHDEEERLLILEKQNV